MNPVYLTTDRQGRYLLMAYYTAGKAVVYPLNAEGTVSIDPASAAMTDKNPHSIQVDPSNCFPFVPKGTSTAFQTITTLPAHRNDTRQPTPPGF